MSVDPNVLYTVKVEILQTTFYSSEYTKITINDRDYGKCYPTCGGCCTWYTCTLSISEMISNGSRASINVQYSGTRVNEFVCNGREEVRLTLELKS